MRQLAHRLVLTENCNASCEHCFNANARDKGVMDADILLDFIKINSDQLRNMNLKIMGGEPTLHPRIIEIMVEASKHYGLVNLFTNGTTMHKIATHPDVIRNHLKYRIKYTINGFTFDPDKFLNYREYVDHVVLHFVITKDGAEKTVENMIEYMKFFPQVRYTYSNDTQVDLFDEKELNEYRKIWLDATKKIVPLIQSRGISFSTDHRFPICFFTQEMLDELNLINLDDFHNRVSCCKCSDIGLIDWNFDLYYCNQTRIKIGSILDENGKPKPVSELTDLITPWHGKKVEYIKKLNDKCKNCAALNSCRVGCYYNTLVTHNFKKEN